MVFLDYTTLNFSRGSEGNIYTTPYKCLIALDVGTFSVAGSNNVYIGSSSKRLKDVKVIEGSDYTFDGGAMVYDSGSVLRVDGSGIGTISGTLHIFRLPESP